MIEQAVADIWERVTMLRVEGHPVQAARYLRPREDRIAEVFAEMDREGTE